MRSRRSIPEVSIQTELFMTLLPLTAWYDAEQSQNITTIHLKAWTGTYVQNNKMSFRDVKLLIDKRF